MDEGEDRDLFSSGFFDGDHGCVDYKRRSAEDNIRKRERESERKPGTGVMFSRPIQLVCHLNVQGDKFTNKNSARIWNEISASASPLENLSVHDCVVTYDKLQYKSSRASTISLQCYSIKRGQVRLPFTAYVWLLCAWLKTNLNFAPTTFNASRTWSWIADYNVCMVTPTDTAIASQSLTLKHPHASDKCIFIKCNQSKFVFLTRNSGLQWIQKMYTSVASSYGQHPTFCLPLSILML